MMAGLRGGRRSAVVTIVAATALVVGSWLVVSASGSPSLARAARPHASTGDGVGAAGAGATTSVGDTTAPPPEQSTGPLATIPDTVDPTTVPTVPATTVTVALPPSTTAPGAAEPVAAPPSVVSTAPVVPQGHHRARHRGAARGGVANPVTGPGSAQTAQVAVELIAALDRQSGGSASIPTTADNVSLLEIWMANEGGLWADNPLNTSLDAGQYPHQYTAGGEDTGIPIFPTMAAGVAATATTLLSNAVYGRIVKLLGAGSTPCLSFAKAVIASPWASSHYDDDTARFCSATPPPPTFRGRHHGR